LQPFLTPCLYRRRQELQRLLGEVDEALRDQIEAYLQGEGLALEGRRLYLDPETGDLALGSEEQAESPWVDKRLSAGQG
jgi:hypothetical protein